MGAPTAFHDATLGKPGVQEGYGGGSFVGDISYSVKVTTSGGFTYIGEAAPGTAQATAAWRCQRVDGTGTTLWADGDGKFNNVATDLTALSYS